MTLREYEEPALFIVVFIGALGEKRIKPLADLLCGASHGVFAVHRSILFDHGGKKYDSWLVGARDDLRDVL
jgi:hypothetical protein